jgi:hypothetical protein
VTEKVLGKENLMTFQKSYSIKLVVEFLQQSRVFAIARVLFTKLFTYWVSERVLLLFMKG